MSHSQPPADDLGALDAEPDAESESIAKLEARVHELEDRRLEERFLWILVVVIILNAWMFSTMRTWGGPVSLLVLELLALLIVARWLRVEEVSMVVNKLLSALGRKNGNDETTSDR